MSGFMKIWMNRPVLYEKLKISFLRYIALKFVVMRPVVTKGVTSTLFRWWVGSVAAVVR